jgi:hypothetical protein
MQHGRGTQQQEQLRNADKLDENNSKMQLRGMLRNSVREEIDEISPRFPCSVPMAGP